MLMVWAAEDVDFERGVGFCSRGGVSLHLSSRFGAQLIAFLAWLCPTGFLTVL